MPALHLDNGVERDRHLTESRTMSHSSGQRQNWGLVLHMSNYHTK